MRIISGTHGRRRISTPKNLLLRPTTDQAKEGLFNILSNRFFYDELDVLDLFSGTGGISYEFISRGAISVTAVEKNLIHFKFITSVKKDFEMDNLETYKGDVFKFLEFNTRSFSLIFADPPFDLKETETIPDIIFKGDHLKVDGILILEHSDENDFSDHEYFIEMRKYGKVQFSFFGINP